MAVRSSHIGFILFVVVALLGAMVLRQNYPLLESDFVKMRDFCDGVNGQYYIEVNGTRGRTAGCMYPVQGDSPYLPPK